MKRQIVVFALFSLIASEMANASSFLPPRLSANAYASDHTVGNADLMLPMIGDNQHNFYLNPNVAYGSDNQGYADLGLGYRWIQNDAAILGLYLFSSYTRIDNNGRLWVANPGIEVLGSRWDAHLNGYITMGDRNYSLGTQVSGPFLFTGHALVGNAFRMTQYAGNGADIKLSYQPFSRTSLKGYVGSYFFNPKEPQNIWGGAAGLEYWMTSNVKVFASYTYDNLHHSTGAFGLGAELGGTHTERINPALEERITDPVERYLAELGQGSTIPSRTVQTRVGSVAIVNNIAFFSQLGGPNNGGIGLNLANCTFENPCGPTDLTDLGASTLNALLPNTQIYFNGGTYNALNVPGGTSGVTLPPGQTIASRTADYSQPATGAQRSTFNGAFNLSDNTLSNIIVLPTPATAGGNGVSINSGGNNVITGSQIGSSDNPYNTGILIDSTNLIINNSAIYGINRGLRDQNRSTLLITDSQISAVHATGGATGISLSQSILVLDNSQIFAQAPGSASGMINGINSLNGSTAEIMNNSSVTVVQTGTANSADALQTDATSDIEMLDGILSATGTTTALTVGPNIVLNGVTCFVNGVLTDC